MRIQARLVSVAVTAALIAGLSPMTAATGAPAEQAPVAVSPATRTAPAGFSVITPCQDVLFVGARGSGQPLQGNSADGRTGLGPQVYSAYNSFTYPLLRKRDVSAVAVIFPAQQVGVIAGTNAGMFFRGLDTGVTWTMNLLKERAESCPGERIVLSGYSQGAMVMHRVIQKLNTSTGGGLVLDRIDGAILIADGDRLRGEKTHNHGSAGRGTGIAQALPKLRSLSGANPAGLPQKKLSAVHSVCTKYDPVCDITNQLASAVAAAAASSATGGPLASAAAAKLLQKVIGIHTAYTGTDLVTKAAEETAAAVLAVPAPRPRQVTVTVPFGQPVSHQLVAHRSPARGTLVWRVKPGTYLPAGVTLSSSGLISGVPTFVGMQGVTAEVAQKVGAVTGPWVPARVTLDITYPETPATINYTIAHQLSYVQTAQSTGTLWISTNWLRSDRKVDVRLDVETRYSGPNAITCGEAPNTNLSIPLVPPADYNANDRPGTTNQFYALLDLDGPAAYATCGHGVELPVMMHLTYTGKATVTVYRHESSPRVFAPAVPLMGSVPAPPPTQNNTRITASGDPLVIW